MKAAVIALAIVFGFGVLVGNATDEVHTETKTVTQYKTRTITKEVEVKTPLPESCRHAGEMLSNLLQYNSEITSGIGDAQTAMTNMETHAMTDNTEMMRAAIGVTRQAKSKIDNAAISQLEGARSYEQYVKSCERDMAD